jgi:hypothetical protein
VYGASAATLAGAMLWSGVNTFDVMSLNELTENLRRQTQDYQARYQQVTAQFPQAPTTADNLRQTVELAEQIRSTLRTPESMFLVVSHALDALPQIQLTRIAWHYGSLPAELEAGRSQPTAKGQATLESGIRVQSAVMRGEIRPFNGDFKAAMGLINAFATQLAADGRVAEVRAVRLPLNVSSDAGLSGSTIATGERNSAEFEFAIIFKAGV